MNKLKGRVVVASSLDAMRKALGIPDWFQELLLQDHRPLDEEAQRVLHENRWDLYEGTEGEGD